LVEELADGEGLFETFGLAVDGNVDHGAISANVP
jgi:hypothetical protein